jgi:acetyl/propionyl-CoA carboxylase alpha subunit
MTFKKTYLRDGAPVEVEAQRVAGDHWRVRVGDAVHEFRAAAFGDGGVRIVPVGADAKPLQEPEKGRARGGAGGGDGVVRAPMTGTVLAVSCKAGDVVAADQTLVVVTAMKMEHKLTAGIAGVVKRVDTAVGATVEQGAALVEVEPQKQEPK